MNSSSRLEGLTKPKCLIRVIWVILATASPFRLRTNPSGVRTCGGGGFSDRQKFLQKETKETKILSAKKSFFVLFACPAVHPSQSFYGEWKPLAKAGG